MNIEIANRLVELRRINSMSQEDLASQLGVSRQAVSKWERGESSPDTDNLIALARLYGISLDELLLDGLGGTSKTGGQVDADLDWQQAQEAERQRRKSMFLKFPYPVFAVLCYLVMGFQWNMWHPGWLIFLTVPLYYWFATVQ